MRQRKHKKNSMSIVLSLIALSCFWATAGFGQPAQQGWQINVRDAELRDFIMQIASLTDKTFVIDPRVKGKVTVISGAILNADATYQLLLSVLRVNQYTAIPAGTVIKIVPQPQAKQSAGPRATQAEAFGEQIVTRIIEVSNLSAAELIPTLRPLVPGYSHIAAVANSNLIIISDHKNNIERLERLIATMESAEQGVVQIVPLKAVGAGTLISLLQRLAPDQLGSNAAGPRQVKVIVNERNNSLLLRGKPRAIKKIQDLIAQLDYKINAADEAVVIRLAYAKAESVAEIVSDLMQTEQVAATGGVQTPFSIQADTSLNAVVVRADSISMANIKSLIASLDVRRTQVLIEAAVVEVSLTKNFEAGTEFAVADQGGSVPFASTVSQDGPLAGLLAALFNSEDGNKVNAEGVLSSVGSTSSALLGIAKLSTNGLSFAALIRLLAQNDQANLLSTPSILTLDNEQAEIIVGQNVPFRTGSYTTTEGGLNPFVVIQRQDIGITLRVTPQINEGDVVRLKLYQEISNLAERQAIGSNAASGLITNKRTIDTVVLADNRQTIVLGGLIQNDTTASKRRVPFFGRIPLIGWLFRFKSKRQVRRNLLVFLRPTILKNKEEVAKITAEKYTAVWEVLLQGSMGAADSKQKNVKAPVPTAPVYESLYKGDVGTP